jgi:hypothetical protein
MTNWTLRSRSAREKGGYKPLIKASLLAAAVLLIADFAVSGSWPNGLVKFVAATGTNLLG